MVIAQSGNEVIDAIRKREAQERIAGSFIAVEKQKGLDQHIAGLRADLEAMVPKYLQRLEAADWLGGHIQKVIVGKTIQRTRFGWRRAVLTVEERAIWQDYFCGITSLGELVEFEIDSDHTWLMGRVVKLDELSPYRLRSLIDMVKQPE